MGTQTPPPGRVRLLEGTVDPRHDVTEAVPALRGPTPCEGSELEGQQSEGAGDSLGTRTGVAGLG